MAEKVKICSHCKFVKPLSKFPKNRSQKDGLGGWCKACHNSKYKEYKRKYMSKYRAVPKNRKRYIKYSQDWRKEHRIYEWANATLSNHKRRGMVVDIARDVLIQLAKNSPCCKLCGIPLRWSVDSSKKNWATFDSPSLDRTENENSLNYNNIQIICHRCNTTKGSRTTKEFVAYCKMIAEKFGEKHG